MQQARLWHDYWFVLGPSGSSADVHRTPPEKYFDFGDAKGATLSCEVTVVGDITQVPNINVEHTQPTGQPPSPDDPFEAMRGAANPVNLARGRNQIEFNFGLDGQVGYKSPSGLGRLVFSWSGASATAFIPVRVRVFVATN